MNDLHSLDTMRGHSLVPTADELFIMPKLYETDGVVFEHKVIYLRYFTNAGAAEWLIVEVDKDPDSLLMFGWCDLGLGMPEWGYVSLHELATLRARSPQGYPIYVERDLHWTPKTFGEHTS